jgi:two-component system CheB/CheR fusion protein
MGTRARSSLKSSRERGLKTQSKSGRARSAPRKPGEDEFVPVFGVGASAGGLDALSQLLSSIPSQCRAAIVVVQHLDPRHESLLSTLLAKKSRLPVVQLGKRVRVQSAHVYVVPPARSVKLVRGILHTAALQKSVGGSSLIDQFFVSVADSLGKRSVGVLLSGSGHDGVAGLVAIQAAGGTTLCQSPESAQMPGMPQAAISAKAADLVLDIRAIGGELVRIGDALCDSSKGTPSEPLPPAGSDPRHDLSGVLAALRGHTGLDFSTYKQSTVTRRLARRMALGKFVSVESYVRHLANHPREAADLAEDLLIHVTKFFRDPAMFAALKRTALPRLLREREGDAPLRIWVAGCATGEEVYSLAISVLSYLEGVEARRSAREPNKAKRPAIQVFGSDISELAIAKARSAIYPAKIRSDVPAAVLRKYFIKVDAGYQVTRQVRALCAFARHDITLDPPFSRLDLISCRNVLIYHTAEVQQRVLSMFHYALLPKGVLILGSSESSGGRPDLFTGLSPAEKLFVKKTARPQAAFRMSASEAKRPLPFVPGMVSDSAALTQLACNETDRILLARIAPASVLVDADLQILQFRGQPGPYIRPVSGTASLSVLKMVHPSLAPELRRALRTVKSAIKASNKTIALDCDGTSLEVRMEVLPIYAAQAQPRHALVMFHPLLAPLLAHEPRSARKRRPPEEQLRRELVTARDQLQSLIAEHEAATEALQATLESGQATNEELQSTNEELETAKEELQSTNEELSTVNDELQARNLELNQLNNDLVHVLASIDMPVLTLGSDARIRRFNQAAERVLNLLPGDIGRLLSDVRTTLAGVDLAKLAMRVIKGGAPAEVVVESRDGDVYLLRARPYPAGSTGVDGVIVTLVSDRTMPTDASRTRKGSRASGG